MIKIATLEDVSIVRAMVSKFIDVSGYKDYTDDNVIDMFISNLLTEDNYKNIILLNDDKGFIAGIASPFIYGTCLQATELAWWVEPEYRKSSVGKELLEAFEYWAKEVANCKLITMSSLDEDVGKFYTKIGYKLYERAYMKEF